MTWHLGHRLNALCGQGKLGVDLMQLVVAPTLAYKLSPQHSVGVAPLLVYQRFKASGLEGFSPRDVLLDFEVAADAALDAQH